VNGEMLKATIKGFDPDMDFNEGMKVQWFNRAEYFTKTTSWKFQFFEQLRYSPLYDKTNFHCVQGFWRIDEQVLSQCH